MKNYSFSWKLFKYIFLKTALSNILCILQHISFSYPKELSNASVSNDPNSGIINVHRGHMSSWASKKFF